MADDLVRPVPRRGDIQGLRAVAVLLVVVAHSGLALPGGFVGVDVFFVISGFVIGNLLLRELGATGSISLGGFWARRARRLLPLLAVVVLVTIGISMLVLNPTRALPIPLNTAKYGSVFSANGYLYRHLGYFDSDADAANPFLHLWSLAVEEQFYLFLAPLILVGWKVLGGADDVARRRRLFGLVAVVSAGSLWLAWAMSTGRSPIDIEAPGRFAFYGSPTRLWEFGAGLLLALGWGAVERVGARLGLALGLAAAAVLAVGAWRIDPFQPYPGLAAVPVVAASVALLVAGARSEPVERALSWGPLRWIGDRSYGWYLWHWPAIVFARLLWPGSTVAVVIGAAGSLGLAHLTYRTFEDRIRRDQRLVGLRAAALAAVCVLVPAGAAAVAINAASDGLGVEEPADWYDLPYGRQNGCVVFNRDMEASWDEAACTTGPDDPSGTVLVIGDEEADGVSTAVRELAADRGWATAEWARTRCPVADVVPEGYPECGDWQDDALALVERLDPDVVVIANQATAYTTDRANAMGQPISAEAWGDALGTTVEGLSAAGVPTVVVGSIPSMRGEFPRPSVIDGDVSGPSRPRAEVDDDHDPVVAAERAALEGLDGVAYVDPVPLLCTAQQCRAVVDGRWRYTDGDALSNEGSRVLRSALEAAIDRVTPSG